ncbi:MAG: hypothetical protein K9J13_04305 [Saprospiraceae bacterium]|nr:hypothetical protein [Saprospiraceae bacterium]
MNIISPEYYRLIFILYLFYVFGRDVFKNKNNEDNFIRISFMIFTLSYAITHILNGGKPLNILSQFFFGYAVVFLLYFGLREKIKNPNHKSYLEKLIVTILFIQVLLSFVKFLIIGNIEAIVGSISAKGAGVAVVFPIFAFIFYRFYKRNSFNTKEWIFAISFFLIAIVSNKRSPVFIFPIIIILMVTYIDRKVNIKSLFKYIPLILIVFYIGIRSNRSFNPENSAWGSFDIEYAIKYAFLYNFGVESLDKVTAGKSDVGRGAGLLMMFSDKELNRLNIVEVLFGTGVSAITLDKGILNYLENMDYDGLIGFFQGMFYMLGICGLVSYSIFIYAIIRAINNKRLRKVLLIFIFWEIFFYGAMSVKANSMAFLLVAIIVYSNALFQESMASKSLEDFSIAHAK